MIVGVMKKVFRYVGNVNGEMMQYKLLKRNNWFNVHVHHWSGKSDLEMWHSHEYEFVAITLKGGGTEYIEFWDNVKVVRKVKGVRYYHAPWKHTVDMDADSWTVIIHGPRWFKNALWNKDLVTKFVPDINRNSAV